MTFSQYDLSLVGLSNTNTTKNIDFFFDSLFLFIVIAFCFSFLCSFFKRKIVPSASDLSTYLYRGRVHGGVEGQRTHINISLLFFVSNGVRKLTS